MLEASQQIQQRGIVSIERRGYSELSGDSLLRSRTSQGSQTSDKNTTGVAVSLVPLPPQNLANTLRPLSQLTLESARSGAVVVGIPESVGSVVLRNNPG